jgi:hypothetical protein
VELESGEAKFAGGAAEHGDQMGGGPTAFASVISSVSVLRRRNSHPKLGKRIAATPAFLAILVHTANHLYAFAVFLTTGFGMSSGARDFRLPHARRSNTVFRSHSAR